MFAAFNPHGLSALIFFGCLSLYLLGIFIYCILRDYRTGHIKKHGKLYEATISSVHNRRGWWPRRSFRLSVAYRFEVDGESVVIVSKDYYSVAIGQPVYVYYYPEKYPRHIAEQDR